MYRKLVFVRQFHEWRAWKGRMTIVKFQAPINRGCNLLLNTIKESEDVLGSRMELLKGERQMDETEKFEYLTIRDAGSD